MKLLGETNCLVFELTTSYEVDSYFNLFGEEGWLDIEATILWNIPGRIDEEITKLSAFLCCDIATIKKAEFVIIGLPGQ